MENHPKKEDYVMTFSASGVSILYTDMVIDMYKQYDPLICIHNSKYFQYLRLEKFELAGNEGISLYGNKEQSEKYFKELNSTCENLKQYCSKKITKEKEITKLIIKEFFDYALRFHTAYSKTGFEHTDKAFALGTKENNRLIIENLNKIGEIKNNIREILNNIFFGKDSYLDILINKLSKKFNVDNEKLLDYTQNEILDLFECKKVDEKELENRNLAFACLVKDNTTTYYAGNAAKKIYLSIVEEETPNKEDYVLSFESQGTTLLFEDIVVNYYMPKGESVSFYKNGVKRVFLSKEMMKKLNTLGEKATVKETKAAAENIRRALEIVKKENDLFRKKGDITLEETKHILNILGQMCKDYIYFDFAYWDTAYKKAENDQKIKENIKLVEDLKNKLRDELDIAFFGENSYLYTLINKLAQKFNLPLKDIEWYTEKEVLALFDDKIVDNEQLSARRKAYWYHKTEKGQTMKTGQEAENLVIAFDKQDQTVVSIIKGKTAHSTGKNVRAKVRVISRDYGNLKAMHQKMNDMQKGEILVTETTDPEMMPALRKASAVITDIGGMLSHSAITARELNIACIVETGGASKILKDGDEIEVNTDTGVIKIVKKHG